MNKRLDNFMNCAAIAQQPHMWHRMRGDTLKAGRDEIVRLRALVYALETENLELHNEIGVLCQQNADRSN